MKSSVAAMVCAAERFRANTRATQVGSRFY